MPTYKLSYFPARGRAEFIRYILAQSGLNYEDIRIPREEWPKIKPTMQMGQIPQLEVDGKQLCQSLAIARFVANEAGLNGKTNWDKALADMYVDGVVDLFQKLTPVMLAQFANDMEKRDEELNKFLNESLPPCLDRYEKFLKDNGGTYFVGNSLTWADLFIAEVLERLVSCFKGDLSKHPALNKFVTKIHELPAIKKYVESREPTPF